MEELIRKIKQFKPRKILVIGDLILDKYTSGKARRISPEYDVIDLDVSETRYNPGGAGNTAVNINTLNSEPYLLGILGSDHRAEIFKRELEQRGINSSGILTIKGRTILKERFLGRNPLLRVNYDDSVPATQEDYESLFTSFSEQISFSSLAIISDYAKNTLSKNLIQKIIQLCIEQRKQVVIDPRPMHADAYKNASYITPNFEEACKMVGKEMPRTLENAELMTKILSERLNSVIILTLDKDGMLFYKDKPKHFPIYQREVRDVSGAGDTVVSAIAVGLANKLNLEEAISFANHAAGVKVEKLGVQPVLLEEVVKDLELHNNQLT